MLTGYYKVRHSHRLVRNDKPVRPSPPEPVAGGRGDGIAGLEDAIVNAGGRVFEGKIEYEGSDDKALAAIRELVGEWDYEWRRAP